MKNLWVSLFVMMLVVVSTDSALAAKSKKKKKAPEAATEVKMSDKKSDEKELADLQHKSEQIEKAEAKDHVVAPEGQTLKEDPSVYTRAYRQKLDEANKENAEAVTQSEKDRARDVQYMKHLDRMDSMDRKANKR